MCIEATQLDTDSEVAEAPSEPTPQRQGRRNDGALVTGEAQCKRRGTVGSTAPSAFSTIKNGKGLTIVETENAASEDASYASLVEGALSVYLQVDILAERPFRVPKAHEVCISFVP